MSKRRLTLRSETLTVLESDDLASVVGALSLPSPLCAITIVQQSQCYSCGFGCTYDCPQTS